MSKILDKGTVARIVEFLKIRLPQIGQEHREYLVAFHAKRLRNELPPMHVRSPELMRIQLTCR